MFGLASAQWSSSELSHSRRWPHFNIYCLLPRPSLYARPGVTIYIHMALNAFVIGAGPGVGFAVARRFVKAGYKVAVGSRNPDIEGARKQGFVPVKVDAIEQDTIVRAFSDVERDLGPINVVIYNGSSYTPPAPQSSMMMSIQ
jgi:hypothetical protein